MRRLSPSAAKSQQEPRGGLEQPERRRAGTPDVPDFYATLEAQLAEIKRMIDREGMEPSRLVRAAKSPPDRGRRDERCVSRSEKDDPVVTGPPIRLEWAEISPENGSALAAYAGGIRVGRVAPDSDGKWRWTMFAFHSEPTPETGPKDGQACDARDAALALETALGRWLDTGSVPWWNQKGRGGAAE